jgi:UDP-glucose 4-epimerase
MVSTVPPPAKALVTGAAGFIGSHLVDALLARGYGVVGIDNMKLGRQANLASARQHPGFKFFEADLNELAHCRKILAHEFQSGPCTVAWHMAANSDIRAGVADPDVDLQDTFLTTFNTLKLLREFQIPRLAFASTSAIYGEHAAALAEDMGPLFPISNYGAMKLASEAAISAALESFLQQVWIFRFPNVIGSRSTHGAIHDFLLKLRRNPEELEVLGDGSQEKPYLHVSELVEAMLFIQDRAQEKLNYFNIAPQAGVTTVRYIAETVVRLAAPNAKIRYTGGTRGWVGDVPKFRYDTTKLKGLGWAPKLSSDAAVELAVRENLSAL